MMNFFDDDYEPTENLAMQRTKGNVEMELRRRPATSTVCKFEYERL